MGSPPPKTKLGDTVPKVAGDISVGEDLEFQRKWWRFEQIVWMLFLAVIVADLLGLFGRGWLAKAEKHTSDDALTLHYERIERTSTPSIMTLDFGPAAIHEGRVQVFVSNSIVKELGARRISPQPQASTIGDNGITYTFPATGGKMMISISLMPELPAENNFEVRVAGSTAIRGHVYVMP
ncbi:MAG TPA: hypothetical protein VGR47_17785 [Terracidiphilus sp.]|nr:hypothetical protein [Terracidiphilus sp.]